jgi:hypothetical protein
MRAALFALKSAAERDLICSARSPRSLLVSSGFTPESEIVSISCSSDPAGNAIGSSEARFSAPLLKNEAIFRKYFGSFFLFLSTHTKIN